MKKFYTIALASALALSAKAQELKPKLSPQTKIYLSGLEQTGQQALPQGYVYKKRNDGRLCVSALIKVYAGAAEKVATQLAGINAVVGTKAGPIWTVQVPVENVAAFSVISGISYIQLDQPMVFPSMDDPARKATRVDSVHGGYALPMPYSGKGVVAGIIDFGFDYNHPNMYDTNGTKYRIARVWEMGGSGTPPAKYSFGNEISDTSLIKAQLTDNAQQMHGSGVAGLFAGSGFGSSAGKSYRGGAYDAEMVMVGVRREAIGGQWFSGGFTDFIDGVSYIFDYARSVSKPAVVNISWGSQSGPHDGSSLVNQAFDTLSGAGKVIVMSGGNDGENNIYLNKTFAATDTVVKTFLRFSATPYKRTWIDIWGDTAKTFCANVILYGGGPGQQTGSVCIDDLSHDYKLISASGLDTCFVKVVTSSAEYNLRPRITLDIYNKSTDSVVIAVTGKSGTVNMWNEYYYYGYTYGYSCIFSSNYLTGFTAGTSKTTVSDMGAAASTLLIGAYTSKVNFTDVNGVPRAFGGVLNRLASFSSKGPMIDGRIKPDITAPGLAITTSLNSNDTAYSATGSMSFMVSDQYTDVPSGKKYYFGEFSGTSAAAPISSGIVAMMLQIDPTLTPAKVKELLFQTAIKDSYTGAIPAAGNNTWGHGKINAYGAVRQLIKETSVYTVSGTEPDCVLYPNPGNGHCTLDFNGTKTERLQVTVTGITGNIVFTTDWAVQAGSNRQQLDLSSVAKGIYLVKVSGTGGAVVIKTQIQ